MLSLFSTDSRRMDILVGPVGMQFLFNNSTNMVRRDILGAPSEMMSALIEALNAKEFKEISFRGSSLWGHIESPEKPPKKAREDEEQEEKVITLQFEDIFPRTNLKILLKEKDVRELLRVLRGYWID